MRDDSLIDSRPDLDEPPGMMLTKIETRGETGFGITLETSVVPLIVKNLKHLLDGEGAPNYLETRFSFQPPDGPDEIPATDNDFIVTIQRASGRTPHEFRMLADEALFHAIQAIDQLRDLANGLIDRMSSDHQAVATMRKELPSFRDIAADAAAAAKKVQAELSAASKPEGTVHAASLRPSREV